MFESLSQTASAWIRQSSRNPCRTAPWTREVTSSCRGPSRELSRLKCHGCTMVRTKTPTVPASPCRQQQQQQQQLVCWVFLVLCTGKAASFGQPSFNGREVQFVVKDSLPEDAGEYACLAENSMGRTSSCGTVKVRGQ